MPVVDREGIEAFKKSLRDNAERYKDAPGEAGIRARAADVAQAWNDFMVAEIERGTKPAEMFMATGAIVGMMLGNMVASSATEGKEATTLTTMLALVKMNALISIDTAMSVDVHPGRMA